MTIPSMGPELSAAGRDVARVLRMFERTARARPLYRSNNAALVRMLDELEAAFRKVLHMLPTLELKVRPHALVFGEEVVLEDDDAESSIPFILFRDGIRRLEFNVGMSREELEIMLEAAQHGLVVRGMDDDVVSFLWRHDLEHVSYVTVSSSVVEVDPANAIDLDAQIEAILRAIYADGEQSGPRTFHLDASDITAKTIADALGKIDDMAPGLHPLRHLNDTPAYAERLLGQVLTESKDSVMMLAGNAVLESFRDPQADPQEAQAAARALLDIFDAALLEERLAVGRWILTWVDRVVDPSRGAIWLEEALSEARVRRLVEVCHERPELSRQVRKILIQGAGKSVPGLLGAIPSFTDPTQRREFSDLAFTLGITDLEPLHVMAGSETGYVACEALYLLGRLGSLSGHVIHQVSTHARPQVRLAALAASEQMHRDVAEGLAIDLIDDAEPRVRMEAATRLAQLKGERARHAISHAIGDPEFDGQSRSTKTAYLKAHASLNPGEAQALFEQLLEDADRRMARKSIQESGAAVVAAARMLPGQQRKIVYALAQKSRSKLVKTELSRVREPGEAVS